MANGTMTNEQYFRSMGKEELAKLLLGFCENSEKCYFCPLYKFVCAADSLEDWIEWLEKPVEVNDNEMG